MIGFGLRLTLRGGREAASRLVIIVAAVALGVGLLLTTLAGINAVNSQNARYAWFETGAGGAGRVPVSSPAAHDPPPPATPSLAGVPPLWWLLTADMFHGQVIGRVDVAATGPDEPVPPGVSQLPGPGEYYASPAMARLLRTVPRDQLAARYPGRMVGTIGAAGLPSPDTLVVLIGHTPQQLSQVTGVTEVNTISTVAPNQCSGDCYFIGIDAQGMDLVLSVVAAALLFPVLIFIGTATRLSAARREQRFAAMRLVGATPRQITVISTVESTVAAALGTALGFGLFYALRPALAPIPFTGDRFYVHDLALNVPDALLVALGVPVAAAVAARLALRRVTISPLGVVRRVTPAAPRAWRLLPLLAGLGELAWFVHAGRPATTGGQILAYLSGIMVTMAGLVFAGPWLTMVGSRLLARRATRPATLIAGRRLADNPSAGFRAVSGLALALFVTSVAVGIITTIKAYDGGGRATAAERATVVQDIGHPGPPSAATPPVTVPAGVRATLLAIPGVQTVTRSDTRAVTNKGRTFSVDDQNLAVRTDGSQAAIELVRGALERAFPDAPVAMTQAEFDAQNESSQRTAAYERLADVVVLTSLPIAGCTLAVSVAAGLNDRKRPFSLLRLAGAPLATLRRVVGLESAVPLLAVAVVSVGTGFLAAYLFLRSQLNETLQAPGSSYYLVVAAGLVASLAIIASMLPVLRRITGPEAARNE
ncbi:MAG TPA: FtsX-like permease family protein [Jatrophihabitantaceae bacterium]|nr:FtsX-like permease family protein [Jatrophihabitantaceae bacterium]